MAMENSLAIPQKVKQELPYDSTILLGIYIPKRTDKRCSKPLTWTLTAALFTKAKMWNNPNIHQQMNG